MGMETGHPGVIHRMMLERIPLLQESANLELDSDSDQFGKRGRHSRYRT